MRQISLLYGLIGLTLVCQLDAAAAQVANIQPPMMNQVEVVQAPNGQPMMNPADPMAMQGQGGAEEGAEEEAEEGAPQPIIPNQADPQFQPQMQPPMMQAPQMGQPQMMQPQMPPPQMMQPQMMQPQMMQPQMMPPQMGHPMMNQPMPLPAQPQPDAQPEDAEEGSDQEAPAEGEAAEGAQDQEAPAEPEAADDVRANDAPAEDSKAEAKDEKKVAEKKKPKVRRVAKEEDDEEEDDSDYEDDEGDDHGHACVAPDGEYKQPCPSPVAQVKEVGCEPSPIADEEREPEITVPVVAPPGWDSPSEHDDVVDSKPVVHKVIELPDTAEVSSSETSEIIETSSSESMADTGQATLMPVSFGPNTSAVPDFRNDKYETLRLVGNR
jgi:hypothetical protein